MPFGSGGGGVSESQQQLDPEFKKLFTENYGSAQDVASGLKARTFAGFTPDQLRGFEQTRQFADPNSEVFAGMRQAFGQASSAAGYTPQSVGAERFAGATVDPAALAQAAQLARTSIRDVGANNVTGTQAGVTIGQIAPEAAKNIRDVTAGSFLNQNIEKYLNPYTENVIDIGAADLERARQQARTVDAAKAAGAKAFGGSRQALTEAETNRAYDENTARMIASQRAGAFDAATRLSEADLARGMQASQLNQAKDIGVTQQAMQMAGQFGLANQDAALRAALANQGIDLSTGTINTQNAQQVALANQAAQNARAAQQANLLQQAGLSNADRALQASLANQGAGLTANQQRIAASGQMANIAQGGQNMGFAGAKNLTDVGLQQQGFTQQQLDAIRNLPLEQQQILNQALGINVGGGSGSTSTSSSRQGILGMLGI